MNTAYKWLFLILLFAAPAFAQNVRVDNVAFSSVQGFPFLPGATITICTAAGAGLPCTPTVAGTCLSISDAVCNQPATITSDTFGNYGFWIQPGSYTYTITKAGFGGFGPKALTLAVPSAGSGPGNFTNLTVSGTVAAGNFNNIKVIDGVKYAQSAAGINQADTDLGSGVTGEIWIPNSAGVVATDAQITVSNGHTLRVMGTLSIDAAGKGPILLGQYAHLTCSSLGSNVAAVYGNNNIIHANTSSITSMVRAKVQDGTLETAYVDGCSFNAGNAPVTRGVIDFTGFNDRGWIDRNYINGYTSGWGIYADSATSVTGQFMISNNWIIPNGGAGTGSCIYLHQTGATNLLYDITLRDNECQLQNNSTTNASLLIDCAGGNPILCRDIRVNGMYFSSTPSGIYDISIGANFTHVALTDVICAGNGTSNPISNCINIVSGATLVEAKGIWNFSGNGSNTNTINDNNFGAVQTITTPHVPSWTSTSATSYVSPNLQVIPTANFGGISVGRNNVQAPEIQLLTGGTAAMRSFGIVANNNAAGDLEFLESTSNTNAPSTQVLTIFPTGHLQPNIGFEPATAGGIDLGIAPLPFGNLWLGTAATNNFKFQPGTTAAARVISMPDPLGNVLLGESLNTGTGVYQTGTGAGCTTAASIGGVCASPATVTFAASFADTNYKVSCSPNGAATNLPSSPYVVTKNVGSVTVNYFAITAAAASWPNIECVAVHN